MRQMNININIHLHHHDSETEVLLREMDAKLDLILNTQELLMTIAQDLEDEVAAETTVIGSVETVVQNLIDAVKAAGTDQAKLTAVLAAAQSNKARLAALAAANTAANSEAVASPAAPDIT